MVAIIDCGIDYAHPDFRNEDGTTRLIGLWDQTIPGNPPFGYMIDTLYSSEQINEALQFTNRAQQLQVVPSTDPNGMEPMCGV
ncbi:hypothetical protein [Anaerocolumna jejuensis]|uniref:hypothetical protein n=1 Tax=Anaerocolumna jejuensis TaxID=259063 RepID=UPI003F7C547D